MADLIKSKSLGGETQVVIPVTRELADRVMALSDEHRISKRGLARAALKIGMDTLESNSELARRAADAERRQYATKDDE